MAEHSLPHIHASVELVRRVQMVKSVLQPATWALVSVHQNAQLGMAVLCRLLILVTVAPTHALVGTSALHLATSVLQNAR